MKKFRMTLAMLVALMVGVTIWSPSAGASATGVAFFYKTGNYTVAVAGNGLNVPYVYGSFTSLVTPVCNWDMSAEFFTTNWTWYKTVRTTRYNGCTPVGSGTIRLNYTARAGYLCSTLRSNSVGIASRCFQIKP